MTQHFTFTVITKLHLTYEQGAKTSLHNGLDLRLELSKNLQKEKYLVRDLPTKEGSHVITGALVQGLIANIKMSHEKGWRDESEHIRYIISELQRGFVQDATVSEGLM